MSDNKNNNNDNNEVKERGRKFIECIKNREFGKDKECCMWCNKPTVFLTNCTEDCRKSKENNYYCCLECFSVKVILPMKVTNVLVDCPYCDGYTVPLIDYDETVQEEQYTSYDFYHSTYICMDPPNNKKRKSNKAK